MLIVHLFVSYAHVNLCHFFSSSWCQGLDVTSACGSSFCLPFLIINEEMRKNMSSSAFLTTSNTWLVYRTNEY